MNDSAHCQGSLLFLYAETPLHVGSGEGLGAVDLPLQRERMSGHPMVPGSGLKGAWREECAQWEEQGRCDAWKGLTLDLFGPEPPGDARPSAASGGGAGAVEATGTGAEGADAARGLAPGPDEGEKSFAAALTIQDARLLLLAVRALRGGWAWLTCPFVLERMARDLEMIQQARWASDVPCPANDDVALVCPGSGVVIDGHVMIEDLAYAATEEKGVQALAAWLASNALPETAAYQAFARRLAAQMVVLSNSEFGYMAQHMTEVDIRVRIDEKTHTVATGALWSEESLPAESLLWSTCLFSTSRNPQRNGRKEARGPEDLRSGFHALVHDRPRIRLGGDQTIGRGIVGVRAWPVRTDKKGGQS